MIFFVHRRYVIPQGLVFPFLVTNACQLAFLVFFISAVYFLLIFKVELALEVAVGHQNLGYQALNFREAF